MLFYCKNFLQLYFIITHNVNLHVIDIWLFIYVACLNMCHYFLRFQGR
jgi:hypothetical protein